MKKILFFALLAFMTATTASAQVSDAAVVKYVKDGVQSGKSQKQLYGELASKGVTKEQLLRLKEKYEQQQSS